jgi:hypothetical protein
MAYSLCDFWRSMDTLPDRQVLKDMIEQGNIPLRICFDAVRRQAGSSSPPSSPVRRRLTV